MGLQFSNNLLDVVKKGWQLVLTTEEDIAGVPEHLKDTMWKAAKAAGELQCCAVRGCGMPQ